MNTEALDAIEKSGTFGNYLIHGIDEIIVPDAISWWPVAPGWQVLGVIALLLCFAQIFKMLKLWWQNRYRREALRQLQSIQQQPGTSPQDVVATLPYYIKVTALKAYPRRDIASLSGDKWLAFLDAHYDGPAFSGSTGEKLLAVAYRPREEWQLDEGESDVLINMSRRWIAKHRETSNV